MDNCSESCHDCLDKDQGVYAYDQAKMIQDANSFIIRVLDEAKERQIVSISIEMPSDPEIKILNLMDSTVKYLSTVAFNTIVSVSFYDISKDDIVKITENIIQRLLRKWYIYTINMSFFGWHRGCATILLTSYRPSLRNVLGLLFYVAEDSINIVDEGGWLLGFFKGWLAFLQSVSASRWFHELSLVLWFFEKCFWFWVDLLY